MFQLLQECCCKVSNALLSYPTLQNKERPHKMQNPISNLDVRSLYAVQYEYCCFVHVFHQTPQTNPKGLYFGPLILMHTELNSEKKTKMIIIGREILTVLTAEGTQTDYCIEMNKCYDRVLLLINKEDDRWQHRSI